jgi:hypothetical protein
MQSMNFLIACIEFVDPAKTCYAPRKPIRGAVFIDFDQDRPSISFSVFLARTPSASRFRDVEYQYSVWSQ